LGRDPLTKKVPLPSGFDASPVGVVTYLNAFSFGAGADPRLKVSVTEVTPGEFTLRYSTAGSTRFLSAVTYNLVYKTSIPIVNDATEAAPKKDSPFYKGIGTRSEDTPSFALGLFGTKPQVFIGLFAFDFTTGYSYRISQELNMHYAHNEANAELIFKTIGDSKVNLVKSSIFYTCYNRLC